MTEFIDTHCHVHFTDYELDADEVISDAIENGVTRMICVGCSLSDSKSGVEIAARHKSIWASIGVHPHEAKQYVEDEKALQELRELAGKPKVVAVGEIGLDYYYNHSDKQSQEEMLRFQLGIAKTNDLPMIFHVREAFDDFFKIFDEYKGIKGVIHSFTADQKILHECLKRGLYIGLNGIMTFTKNEAQLKAAKSVPLDSLLLETDAPYLTPVPFRGKICQPKYVVETAKFLAKLRGESLEKLATATTNNGKELFRI